MHACLQYFEDIWLLFPVHQHSVESSFTLLQEFHNRAWDMIENYQEEHCPIFSSKTCDMDKCLPAAYEPWLAGVVSDKHGTEAILHFCNLQTMGVVSAAKQVIVCRPNLANESFDEHTKA